MSYQSGLNILTTYQYISRSKPFRTSNYSFNHSPNNKTLNWIVLRLKWSKTAIESNFVAFPKKNKGNLHLPIYEEVDLSSVGEWGTRVARGLRSLNKLAQQN